MLSVSGPENIPGKMVSTSNCIDLQEPLGRVYFDDAGIQVDTPANGSCERDQDLPISFPLNQKKIGSASPEHVGHFSQAPVSRRQNLQAYQAENIIGALGKVNQILTVEEDIRAYEGLG